MDDFLANVKGRENAMKRVATIRIEPNETAATDVLRSSFLAAWETGEYQGEHFSFESPAALFGVLSPKRWELLAALQAHGPLGVRALARELGRDVKRVHEDAAAPSIGHSGPARASSRAIESSARFRLFPGAGRAVQPMP